MWFARLLKEDIPGQLPLAEYDEVACDQTDEEYEILNLVYVHLPLYASLHINALPVEEADNSGLPWQQEHTEAEHKMQQQKLVVERTVHVAMLTSKGLWVDFVGVCIDVEAHQTRASPSFSTHGTLLLITSFLIAQPTDIS